MAIENMYCTILLEEFYSTVGKSTQTHGTVPQNDVLLGRNIQVV